MELAYWELVGNDQPPAPALIPVTRTHCGSFAGRRLGAGIWQMPTPLAAAGLRHISLDALKPSDK